MKYIFYRKLKKKHIIFMSRFPKNRKWAFYIVDKYKISSSEFYSKIVK